MLGKYKYYLRKPRSEIAKDIFKIILLGGVIIIAASSPYFITNLLKSYSRFKKYKRKKIANIFYKLRQQGLIEIEKENHQIYISLTEEGKKKAGLYQIDSLKIPRPQKWDRLWRIIIFDIAHLKKVYREALRGKLKQLNFYPLQKSVWVHPFACSAEIQLLKDFFGFDDSEIRLIVAKEIGNDKALKKFFKLS